MMVTGACQLSGVSGEGLGALGSLVRHGRGPADAPADPVT